MSKNYLYVRNLFFLILIILIIFVGIYLRTKLFISQIPLEHDERLLGLNFFDSNVFIFFKSINIFIKMPPLWGLVNQCIFNLFGHNFLTFRLIPYLAGILSLPAFFLLLKNLFKSKVAIIICLFIFATRIWLIFYSGFFKQYSCDVLVCILLLYAYKYISFKNISNQKVILYSIITILLQLFSFPVMFIIPSIIFAKIIEEKHFNYKCLFILLAIILSGLYLYFMDVECYKYMKAAWTSNPLGGFYQVGKQSFNIFINNIFEFIFNIDNKIYITKWFCLAGLILFFIDKQKEKFLFLFIIIFVLTASILKIYPAGERTVLYIFPIIFILLTKVIDFPQIEFKNKLPRVLLFFKSIVLGIIILNYANIPSLSYLSPSYISGYYMENRYQREDFLKYSKSILEEYSDDEKIILPHIMHISLSFYNLYFNLNRNYVYFLYHTDKNEIKNLIDKEKLDNKTIILSLIESWSFNSDTLQTIEQELKNKHIKYNKIINNNFVKLEIL